MLGLGLGAGAGLGLGLGFVRVRGRGRGRVRVPLQDGRLLVTARRRGQRRGDLGRVRVRVVRVRHGGEGSAVATWVGELEVSK